MRTNRRQSKSVRDIIISVIAGLIVALCIWLANLVGHQLDGKTVGASSHRSAANSTSNTTSNSQGSPSPTEVQPQMKTPPRQPSPTQSTAQPSTIQSPPSVLSPAPAIAKYLSDLTPLPNDTPNTTPQEMSGVYYLNSVSTDSGGCGDNTQDTYSYIINREYRTFKAVVGLNDQSLDKVPVGVEINADGRTIYSEVFMAGHIANIKLNIIGVRELDLKQTYLGPNPNTCSRSVTVVWGNAEVFP